MEGFLTCLSACTSVALRPRLSLFGFSFALSLYYSIHLLVSLPTPFPFYLSISMLVSVPDSSHCPFPFPFFHFFLFFIFLFFLVAGSALLMSWRHISQSFIYVLFSSLSYAHTTYYICFSLAMSCFSAFVSVSLSLFLFRAYRFISAFDVVLPLYMYFSNRSLSFCYIFILPLPLFVPCIHFLTTSFSLSFSLAVFVIISLRASACLRSCSSCFPVSSFSWLLFLFAFFHLEIFQL